MEQSNVVIATDDMTTVANLIDTQKTKIEAVNVQIENSNQNNTYIINNMLDELIEFTNSEFTNNVVDDINSIESLLVKYKGTLTFLKLYISVAHDELRKPKWYEFSKKNYKKTALTIWNNSRFVIGLYIKDLPKQFCLILKKLNLIDQTKYTILLLHKMFSLVTILSNHYNSFDHSYLFTRTTIIFLTEDQAYFEINNATNDINLITLLFDKIEQLIVQ